MIKFNKVLLTQDEIELLSELLMLEEQDRNPMFANIIDDEKLSILSLKMFKKTYRGKILEQKKRQDLVQRARESA